MDRANHYESAFEAYLQANKICYVAVDEQRRSSLGGEPVKSLDFIIYGENGLRFVVDIKGRKFPSGPPEKPRRVWECWSTVADIDGLERWAQISGPSFQGLLVFVYQLDESIEFDSRIPDLWNFRNHRYLARAVLVNDYRANMRVRSPKWGTVDLPGKVFRSLVRPLAEFLELPEFLESPEPDEWN